MNTSQVARHPNELEQRHLSQREPLDHRVRRGVHPAVHRTPKVGGEAEAEVVVGVEGGDSAEQVLEVLAGQRGGVGDSLLLVHQDVARRVVRPVSKLFHLQRQKREGGDKLVFMLTS